MHRLAAEGLSWAAMRTAMTYTYHIRKMKAELEADRSRKPQVSSFMQLDEIFRYAPIPKLNTVANCHKEHAETYLKEWEEER